MELTIFHYLGLFMAASVAFTWILGNIPQKLKKNYNAVIKKARQEKKLSTEQLAFLVKATKQEIEEIEAGKMLPSNKQARELEAKLGIVILRFNTFFIVTLIKTTRIKIFDKFAKHKKIINGMTDLGLFLGFGAITADYLFGRKQNTAKRILLFVLSSGFLLFLFNFVLAGLLHNPFIKELDAVLAASFAIAGFSGFVVVSMIAYGGFIIQSIFAGQQVCPGVAPLIPGIELPNVPVVLPLHAWLSFLIILVVHEGMHAITARKNNYTIKSAGILLFGFLPIGAFVEPDEKEISSGKDREALRIFAAGPTGNIFAVIILTIAIVLFMALIFVPFILPWQNSILSQAITGFSVADVKEKIVFCGKEYAGPAFGVLSVGSRIIAINGQPVEIGKPLNLKPNQPAQITVEENRIEATKTIVPTELGQLGFSLDPIRNPNYETPVGYKVYQQARNFLASFFFWLIILNFLVAIVNFLPIEPFDGGKIAKTLLYPYFGFLNMSKEETQKLLGRVLLWIVAVLLIVNALPLFL